jgi:hypothetical protein
VPAAWSAKDERKYKAIRKSCLAQDGRRTRACTRIAAATVNRDRKREGRTLSGLDGLISPFPILVEFAAVAALVWAVRRVPKA